jgi:hypothetical protein
MLLMASTCDNLGSIPSTACMYVCQRDQPSGPPVFLVIELLLCMHPPLDSYGRSEPGMVVVRS